MIETTVTCDMCGKKRDEKNHWFEGGIKEHESGLVGEIHLGLEIFGFGKSYCGKTAVHLCGSSCVLKFVSERLEKL